jgi:peroxiredoxin
MVWAGISNYQRRKREQAKLQGPQLMLVPDNATAQPAGSAPPAAQGEDADTAPWVDPLQDKPAPNFTLEDLQGKKVSLSSFKGKAVVVDFWATWCAPCKVEIPWFEKLQDQYASQGLQIVGISADDLDKDDKAQNLKDKKEIADFVAKMHMNYPVLIDADSIAKPYGGLDALPTTFFIDRSGKVIAATLGLADRDEIEANIKKALASGGSQS